MSSRVDAQLEGRTMHPCLCIPEIQQLILSSLQQFDCTQVALVCKTFYDVAMDIIWADVETLVPFARCMPPEVLVETARNDVRGLDVTIDFSREPSSLDWSMFSKHACRVKSFSCNNYLRLPRKDTTGTVYHLSLDAMKTVTEFIRRLGANGTSALFPRLSALRDRVLYEQFTHWHQVFTASLYGNTLRSLSFVFCRPRHDEACSVEVYTPLEESLSRLEIIWPRLRSLYLTCHGFASKPKQVEGHHESFIRVLKNFRQLQYFRADFSLHPSIIDTLAELPLLRTLELLGDEEVNVPFGPDGRSQQMLTCGFPSLTSLVLAAETPASWSPTHLLHALRGSETLTNIDIHLLYTSFEADIDLATYFEAFSQIPRLEILSVALESWFSNVSLNLSGKLLATLFRLRHLKELVLQGFSDITLVDSDLMDAASAWPTLENICIDYGDHPFANSVVPSLSLCGVQALYNDCPNIREIFLVINDSLPLVNGNLELPVAQPRDKMVELLTVRLRAHHDSSREQYADLVPTVTRLLFPRLVCLDIEFSANEYEVGPETSWLRAAQRNWDQKYQHMELTQAQQSLRKILGELSSKNVSPGTDDEHSGLIVVA